MPPRFLTQLFPRFSCDILEAGGDVSGYVINICILPLSPDHTIPGHLSILLFYTIATSSSVPRQRWLIVIEKKVGALIAFYRALASRIFRTWSKNKFWDAI